MADKSGLSSSSAHTDKRVDETSRLMPCGGRHYVIIGNGPAGRQAALTLRRILPQSRITVISKEMGSTYLPKLLTEVICGRLKKEEIYSCPVSRYQEEGIKLRSGQRVAAVNIVRRELCLGHKEIIPFDGLIIAVGGKPRLPEKLHAYAHMLYTLKTVRDAGAWAERLGRTDSVLIIGGDLASLSVTKVLLEMGKQITFILNQDAFWPLRCTEEMFADAACSLKEKGIEVLMGRKIRRITTLDDGTYEVFVDDQSIKVGMIGAFYGYEPDIDFLVGCGLKIDRGILVDENLFTGVEGIYATGDCAQIFHPELNDYWISIGHENARQLGHVAALNLAGADPETEVKPESIFNVQGINVNTSWWTEF